VTRLVRLFKVVAWFCIVTTITSRVKGESEAILGPRRGLLPDYLSLKLSASASRSGGSMRCEQDVSTYIIEKEVLTRS